jgi:hypothetical protein
MKSISIATILVFLDYRSPSNEEFNSKMHSQYKKLWFLKEYDFHHLKKNSFHIAYFNFFT